MYNINLISTIKYCFIFTLSTWITICYSQTATTIYTPKNSTVPDTYFYPELTTSQIASANNFASSNYPLATKLSDASSTYNCHAYAWHMTEGGNAVWLGASTATAEDVYWTDGSYIEVCNQAYATKVSYASDNHSAVTTSTSNTFVSKWGQLPLMQHDKDYMPYNSSVLKYYLKTPSLSISGPSHLCDQATYSISNLPTGAQITNWEVIGYCAEVSSFSGNQANITRTDYGDFKLKATISIGCATIEIESNQFSSGNPYFVNSLEAYNDGMGTSYGELCSDAYNYDNYYNVFTYQLNALPAYPLTLHYSIYDQNGLVTSSSSTISSNSGSYILPLLSPGYYSLMASVSGGPCNEGSEPFELELNYVNCDNFNRMAIYPNPVSSELKISYQESEKTLNKGRKTMNDFSVKLFNDKGQVQREAKASLGKDITLQVADLPNGTYYLHIIEGKNVKKQQVLISH